MAATLPVPSTPSLRLVIAAGSLITSVVIGIRLTFGLYLDPVITELNTDRGTFALAIAIQNLLWGLSQPVAGAVADRFGTAKVLAVGGVGYAASMLLMATADGTGLLILSAGFLVGIATGAASFAVVLAAVGRIAPPERRSMALGIVTAMGSVGQFVLVPAAQRLLDSTDWRTTVTIMGLVALLVVIAAVPFRGKADDLISQAAAADDADQGNTLRQELRRAFAHRSYLFLNLAFFVCGFHVTFIGTHLPTYVTDQGISASVGATALSLIGLFNIVGSLVAGALGGRYSKTKLLAIIYAMRAVFIGAYVFSPISATSTIVFGATFGLLWLSTVPLTSGIITSQFGTRHSGSLFGIVFLAHQLGAFVGVLLGGELADATGSYRLVWLIALALGLFAAIMHMLIDEGPAPAAPDPAERRPTMAPAGAAAAVALVGLASAAVVITAGTTDASADEPAALGATSLFCPLGGVHVAD
ncbi:MAG: MFS transporter [Actinomycetota bacterium]